MGPALDKVWSRGWDVLGPGCTPWLHLSSCAALVLLLVILGIATIASSVLELRSLLHHAGKNTTSENAWKPRGLLPTRP